MAQTTKATPEELRTVATFIEQKKADIDADVKEIKDKIDEVIADLAGLTQDSFISSFEDNMYPIMRDTLPLVLDGVCAQLRGAADAIETTDEEIAND